MATVTQVVTVEPCSEVASDHGQTSETQALDSKERMPPLMSLVVIHYFLVLTTVSVVITIPTASEYAERLGGGRLFAGLMIGALPLLSRLASKRVSVLPSTDMADFVWSFRGIAGNLFTQKLFSCMPFKHIWVICALGSVLGSVLYALAGLMKFKWTLLIARGLMGFFSAFSLPSIYVSHTVGMQRRNLVKVIF